eukprot:Phypoly_transcript_08638.p1 GENE.Phypoly_transcript_08638~~Phypoly_transcript_08638.p1  ORF type:complete len:460 (+),score=33.93 Phypoly_transcript_08638:49-1380(+)
MKRTRACRQARHKNMQVLAEMKKPKRSSTKQDELIGGCPPIKRAKTSSVELLPVQVVEYGRFYILPKELVVYILSFLDHENISNVASTTQELHTLVKNTNYLWKICYATRFLYSSNDDPASDRSKANQLLLQEHAEWKEAYTKKCKVEDNWKNGKFSVSTFKGHTDWVRCLQFEKDMLISGSADKSIKIWDMNTQECLKTLVGHHRCINCLSYDNNLLASACTSVKIWNLSDSYNSGKPCTFTLRGHEDCVWCIQLKGNLCVSGSSDKTLRVWDVEKGACLQVLTGHSDCVCCLQVLPYKNVILSGSSDSTVRCYDLRSRGCQSILETHSDRVWCLQSEGNTLITGSSDKTIKVWDLRTKKCQRIFSGHTNSVWGLQMDGDKLVSGSADSTVRLWDMKKRSNPCVNVINPNVGCVECLQFEGSRLVCGSSDSIIKMYDFSTSA